MPSISSQIEFQGGLRFRGLRFLGGLRFRGVFGLRSSFSRHPNKAQVSGKNHTLTFTTVINTSSYHDP